MTAPDSGEGVTPITREQAEALQKGIPDDVRTQDAIELDHVQNHAKRWLAAQPKVRMNLPYAVTTGLNGYMVTYGPGTVEIPESQATMVERNIEMRHPDFKTATAQRWQQEDASDAGIAKAHADAARWRALLEESEKESAEESAKE